MNSNIIRQCVPYFARFICHRCAFRLDCRHIAGNRLRLIPDNVRQVLRIQTQIFDRTFSGEVAFWQISISARFMLLLGIFVVSGALTSSAQRSPFTRVLE